MDIRPLPAEEAAVRRYVEELWLPYNREFETIVDDFALADDVDLVEEEVAFRLDRLDSADYQAWVAIDGGEQVSEDKPLADVVGEFVGFITTEKDEAPSVFDRPDRIHIGDIYVAKSYRGTGLARRLVDCAVERAHEQGCAELSLDVDVENERALAFYDKLGFDTYRRTLLADVDELS